MPAPASCPAHSLSAASSSGFESCPPLQRLLTSIQQAGHQDDKSSRPLPCPGGGGGAAVSPGLPENPDSLRGLGSSPAAEGRLVEGLTVAPRS